MYTEEQYTLDLHIKAGLLLPNYDQPLAQRVLSSYEDYQAFLAELDSIEETRLALHAEATEQLIEYKYDSTKELSPAFRFTEEEEAGFRAEREQEAKEEAAAFAQTMKDIFERNTFTEDFFKTSNLLLIEATAYAGAFQECDIECISPGAPGTVEISLCLDYNFSLADCDGTLFLVPVEKGVTEAKITTFRNEDEDETMETLKPIVCLYPEAETEVSVSLGYPEYLSVSYPTYTTGWKVVAKPNGDLRDLTTGRELYSLYYESSQPKILGIQREGFVVKGSEVTEFLEEKLEILGLSPHEAEEFIIYWLPVLQENEYNYIRFATMEEIDAAMPLTIHPQPDTTIRVWMCFQGLDAPIEVTEQTITTPERHGFTAVEWGGINLSE